MVVDKDGEPLARGLQSIPPAMWVFLLSQLVAIVVWGVRIDGRVTAIEVDNVSHHRLIESIDAHGSRGLQLLDERQKVTSERMNAMQRQLDYLQQLLLPHTFTPVNPAPQRFIPQGDSKPAPQ